MTGSPSSYGLRYGIAAVILAVLAWHQKDWSPAIRTILQLTAFVLAAMFLFWIFDTLIYLAGKLRAAYYSPIVRQLEIIRSMNELQLAAVGQGLVRLTKIPTNAGLITQYRAPGMLIDLDRDTVERLAEMSIDWPRWPELPPQHGMPEARARDELRAFTQMVVTLGLAEQPRGNLPARWVVGSEKIFEGLEL